MASFDLKERALMSFYLIGRPGSGRGAASNCLPVRHRVFILVLVVVMVFVAILSEQGHDPTTAIALAVAASAVAAAYVRRMGWRRPRRLSGLRGPRADSR
jgi:hypothetical protein